MSDIEVNSEINNEININVETDPIPKINIEINSETPDLFEVMTTPLFGPEGKPGRGIVNIEKTSTVGLIDTYTINYTDDTTSAYIITNGADGEDGSSIDTIEKTSTSGLIDTYTITLTDGSTSTFNVTNGQDGQDGEDGQDGFSPVANVTKSGDTATITITDSNGTTTATVTDGQDGNDGYSPTANVVKVGNTSTITITDKDGTTTANVNDGAKGDTGDAATLNLGTVSTGAAGTNVIITNSGDEHNAVFNFTIPRGNKGDTGETGSPADISAITATVSNTVGTPTVTVTKGGTSEARTFNFAFTNLKGVQGIQGEAATIEVGTVTTVNYDQPATVTNVGTDEEAILDFEIPRGVPGSSAGITAGAGIDVTGDTVSVKYDNSTIKVNSSNQLYFNNSANYQTATQVSNSISAYHDNTKQNVINDLATIRSGAALGATSLQPSDLSEYTANEVQTLWESI